jgi:hypothetical protein
MMSLRPGDILTCDDEVLDEVNDRQDDAFNATVRVVQLLNAIDPEIESAFWCLKAPPPGFSP